MSCVPGIAPPSCFGSSPTHATVVSLLAAQVADVKAKIAAEQGDNYAPANQVLIYQGKVGGRVISSMRRLLAAQEEASR